MQTHPKMPETGGSADQWSELLERYHGDGALRARIHDGEASQVLSEFGISMPEHMETRIVENTDEVTHFILPPDPNRFLSDERLRHVAGGDCAGSLGTVGSWGSIPSCLSSVGSAGSISSASI